MTNPDRVRLFSQCGHFLRFPHFSSCFGLSLPRARSKPLPDHHCEMVISPPPCFVIMPLLFLNCGRFFVIVLCLSTSEFFARNM